MLTTSPIMFQPAIATQLPARIRQQDEHARASPESTPSSVVSLSAEAVRLSGSDTSAIRYGYCADGTYFGSPAEFFATQKAHYQQLGYEVTEEWMAYFAQAIMHPNPNGGVIEAPPSRSGDSPIKIADTLTDMDKTIIQRVSPFQEGIAGPRQINALATIIALERHHGNLTGEIDAGYASGLKQRLVAGNSEAVSLDMLDKLISAVSADVQARGSGLHGR